MDDGTLLDMMMVAALPDATENFTPALRPVMAWRAASLINSDVFLLAWAACWVTRLKSARGKATETIARSPEAASSSDVDEPWSGGGNEPCDIAVFSLNS